MRRILIGVALCAAVGSPAQAQQRPVYEQITVADTAIGFDATLISPSGSAMPSVAVCTLETAEIRYSLDGTDPSSTVGTPMSAGTSLTLTGHAALANFKAIRTGSTSGKLNCLYTVGAAPVLPVGGAGSVTGSNVDADGNAIVVSYASAAGGWDTSFLAATASTNATSVKASAGSVYGFSLSNTTTTVYYLRMYNLASAPTCSSATGFVETIPIPPAGAAGQVGGRERWSATPQEYDTGIAFCITGGASSTDNTNAAAGVYVTIGEK